MRKKKDGEREGKRDPNTIINFLKLQNIQGPGLKIKSSIIVTKTELVSSSKYVYITVKKKGE